MSLPSSMRAARIHAYGGPEVFSLDEVPVPSFGPHDVLVEVHASSVNPVDWKIRDGSQRVVVRHPFPWILGLDVSGIVVAKGAEVQSFALGDEVFSSPTHRRPGCYAEYVAIDARHVAKKPARLSHTEAATIPLVGLTAWAALVVHGRVSAGQRVFVQAGAGGVGSAAIQIAKHFGAEVTTTCGPRNVELVKLLGADHVLDHTQTRFDDVLRDFDVVLESLGGDVTARALKILKAQGRLGSINGQLPENVEKHGAYLGTLRAGLGMLAMTLRARLLYSVHLKHVLRPVDGAMLAQIAGLVEQGALRPVIDRVFPLAAIQDAHRANESGHTRGKIAIAVR